MKALAAIVGALMVVAAAWAAVSALLDAPPAAGLSASIQGPVAPGGWFGGWIPGEPDGDGREVVYKATVKVLGRSAQQDVRIVLLFYGDADLRVRVIDAEIQPSGTAGRVVAQQRTPHAIQIDVSSLFDGEEVRLIVAASEVVPARIEVWSRVAHDACHWPR